MQKYSFGTLVTSQDDFPIATHLPFVVQIREAQVIVKSHFAKANHQWQHLQNSQVLVIFNEPHAYISPVHYNDEKNVPTWNYFSVHAYGRARLILDNVEALGVLEDTIKTYEPAYHKQWDRLPESYRGKMMRGIIAFEVEITQLQAKKKLSQNKMAEEQQRIINHLETSDKTVERDVAFYMQQNLASK